LSRVPVRSLQSAILRAPQILLFSVLALSAASAQTKRPATATIDTLIREGKLDQAERQLQASLQNSPQDIHALTTLGEVREKQGKYINAEKLFLKALQIDPNAHATLFNLGWLYAEEDRADEAIPIYEALQSASPKNLKLIAALAVLYQKQGNYQKSIDLAEQIPAASRPSSLLIALVADNIGLKRSDHLQAAADAVLRRAPTNPGLVPQLANVFLDNGMVGDAIGLLQMAGKHQRPTANYLAALAKAQAMSGHREEARTTIAKSLQLDPKSRDVLTVAARLAGIDGEWKMAMKYLQEADKGGPPTAELLQNLVFACIRSNDLQAAHDAALDLLDIQPNSPEAGLVMCAVLIRAAHWGEADPILDKILTVRPNDKKVLLGKGVVDYNMDRIDDAQKHLTASLGQGAGDAEANYYLGLIAKQKGDFAGAATYLELSLKAGASNPDAMTALGQIYLAMGEAEKAKSVLEQAVSTVPNDAQTHYQLALAYKRLGLNDKAREQMTTFQQLSVREGAKQPVGHVMNSPK